MIEMLALARPGTADPSQDLLAWGVALGASLLAAFTDARSRRIPNLLTLPALAAGLAWAGLSGGVAGLGEALLATLLLALPFVLLFVFAGGGAGDAKLMGALGAWLGMHEGLRTLVCVCLAGVVMALAWAAAKRHLPEALARCGLLARGGLHALFGGTRLRDLPGLLPGTSDGEKMPYGLAICAGVLCAFTGAFA